MKQTIAVNTMMMVLCALPAVCQRADKGVTIYRVTVIERTVKAINYQYRSEPTMIDFSDEGLHRAVIARPRRVAKRTPVGAAEFRGPC